MPGRVSNRVSMKSPTAALMASSLPQQSIETEGDCQDQGNDGEPAILKGEIEYRKPGHANGNTLGFIEPLPSK